MYVTLLGQTQATAIAPTHTTSDTSTTPPKTGTLGELKQNMLVTT